jgi:hypothetical protein
MKPPPAWPTPRASVIFILNICEDVWRLLSRCPAVSIALALASAAALLRGNARRLADALDRHSSPSGVRIVRFAVLGLSLALVGCAAAPQREHPLPAALAANASIPGIPGARYWGDERPAGLTAWLTLPENELRAR